MQVLKFRPIITFLFVVFFSFGLQAQLLWRISGNGLNKPSYLYGTLHVAPKNEFYLNPKVKEVIKTCDVLALEIAPKLKEMIAVAPMMMLPGGKTIQNYLDSADFQRFQDYCLNTVKIKEKKFDRYRKLKPFFVSSDLLIQQLGKYKSVEKELQKLAKKNKMETVGLETLEFQMETVNQLSIEQGYEMLMQDLGTEMTEFKKLLAAYQQEKLDELGAMMAESEASIPGFEELFLNIRNRNWIPVIQEMTKEKSAFIAVGAAHLIGDQGVIQLLRNEGFVVEAVK